MKSLLVNHRWWAAVAVAASLAGPLSTEAGWPRPRRTRAAVPTAARYDTAPSPMLGTFYPEPTLVIRGNGSAGGGYSPLGQSGDTSLSHYGPLSALRPTAAPVVTYSRGYDGMVRPVSSVGFSTPNQPELTPIIYPTRANLYGGFHESGTPPWWPSAINYLDMN